MSLVRLRVPTMNWIQSRARANDRGLGLVSMQERLRFGGGEFFIWSKPSLVRKWKGGSATT